MINFLKEIKLWNQKRSPLKWYQSLINKYCCRKQTTQQQEAWQFILEQAELANETWYVQQELASPARESFSDYSNE